MPTNFTSGAVAQFSRLLVPSDTPPRAMPQSVNIGPGGTVVIDAAFNAVEGSFPIEDVVIVTNGSFVTASRAFSDDEGFIPVEIDCPASAVTGSDSFTLKLVDTDGNYSNVVTISIAITNTAPVATPLSATVRAGGTVTIPTDGAVTDADGNLADPPALAIHSQGSKGTASVNADGTLKYVANASVSGTDTFYYKPKDLSNVYGSPVDVTITIQANQAPVCADSSKDIVIGAGAQTVNLSTLASDPDGDSLTYTVIGSPGLGCSASVSGSTLSITPGSTAGSTSLTYRATDPSGAYDEGVISIDVVASAATLTVPDFTWNTFDNVAGGDIDVLSMCTASTGASDMTIDSISQQPSGSGDSATISGSGSNAKIAYLRGSTVAGTYTMKVVVKLISDGTVKKEGTVTIVIADTSAKWWMKPHRRNLTSGVPYRRWYAGPGYFDANPKEWPDDCGYAEAFTVQMMHSKVVGDHKERVSERNWEAVWGGSETQSYSNLTNATDSQTDWSGKFSDNLDLLEDGSGRPYGFMCAVFSMIPVTETSEVKAGGDVQVWKDIANGESGSRNYDEGFKRFGKRLGLNLINVRHWTKEDCDKFFVLRPNHEMNQSNIYQVYDDTKFWYKAAMERAFTQMRKGFSDATGGARLRIVHSPARAARLKTAANNMSFMDYAEWVPVQGPMQVPRAENYYSVGTHNNNGGVDMLTLSYHPADDAVKDAASKTQLQIEQDLWKFMRRWNNGSYGTIDDVLPSCKYLGLPYCNPEWSPRFEVRRDKNKVITQLPLKVAHTCVRMMYKLFDRLATEKKLDFPHMSVDFGAAGNLVFDTMFDQTMLNKEAYGTDDKKDRNGNHWPEDSYGAGNWRTMVDDVKKLWKGYPIATVSAPPPRLDAQDVPLQTINSGQSFIDIDVLRYATGTETVSIKDPNRITAVDAPGAPAPAELSWVGGKLRFTKKGLAPRATPYVFYIELKLATTPLWKNQKVSVKVS